MEELQNKEVVEQSIVEDRQWCVYIHTNKSNNKVYIGMTSQTPERRWQNGYGYKNNQYFWRSIEKYGWDQFEHIIFAEHLTKYEAEHMEILLIALYDTTNPECGYNISVGGEAGHTGVKHSDEAKRKIVESNHKRFANPENHPMYGKHHSSYSKKKIRETKLNSASTYSNDYLNSIKISFYQYDKNGEIVDEFFGVRSASEKTGISRSAIANCLCGLSRTAGGYIWKKKNEDISDDTLNSSI